MGNVSVYLYIYSVTQLIMLQDTRSIIVYIHKYPTANTMPGMYMYTVLCVKRGPRWIIAHFDVSI